MSQPLSFSSATQNFSLPLLFSGQSQKEFVVNGTFCIIDSLLQKTVIGSLSAPPADAAEGACFRVLPSATGEWNGKDNQIAVYIGQAWHFVSPFAGLTVFDQSAGHFIYFDVEWQAAQSPAALQSGATIDSEARTAIAELIEALQKTGILSS